MVTTNRVKGRLTATVMRCLRIIEGLILKDRITNTIVKTAKY